MLVKEWIAVGTARRGLGRKLVFTGKVKCTYMIMDISKVLQLHLGASQLHITLLMLNLKHSPLGNKRTGGDSSLRHRCHMAQADEDSHTRDDLLMTV